MAKYDDRKNAALAVALRRQSSSPLDVSSVFNSIADFEAYVKQNTNYGPYSDAKENSFLQKINPYSYAGQVVTVLDAATGTAKTFVINKAGPLGTGTIDTNIERLDGAVGPHIRYNNGEANIDLAADTWYYSAFNKKYFKFGADGAYQITETSPGSAYSSANAIPETVTEFQTTIGGKLQKFEFTEDIKARYTEVGSVPAVDGKSIKAVDVVTADGKTVKTLEISSTTSTLADVESKKGTDAAYEAGTVFQLTLDLNGNVKWVKVDTTTVEGLGTKIDKIDEDLNTVLPIVPVIPNLQKDIANLWQNAIEQQAMLDDHEERLDDIEGILGNNAANYVINLPTIIPNLEQNDSEFAEWKENIVDPFIGTFDANVNDFTGWRRDTVDPFINSYTNVIDNISDDILPDHERRITSLEQDGASFSNEIGNITASYLKDVAYNASTGEFTFTKIKDRSGTEVKIDLALERVVTNFFYTANGETPETGNYVYQNTSTGTIFISNSATAPTGSKAVKDSLIIELELEDNSPSYQAVNLSKLIDTYTVNNTNTITLNMTSGHEITANIAAGAIDNNNATVIFKDDALTTAFLNTKIADSAITNTVLNTIVADDAITDVLLQNKIKDGAISNVVLNTIIEDSAFTHGILFDKVANDAFDSLVLNTKIADSAVTNTVLNTIIASDAIDTAILNSKIKDSAVTNTVLNTIVADCAITTGILVNKVANDAITTAVLNDKIADSAVTNDVLNTIIADGAITADIIGAKIAEYAINDSTLTTILADDAIDTDVLHSKIADDAIDEMILGLKVANDAIDEMILRNKLANDAINNFVLEDKVADNAITSDVLEYKLADTAINFYSLYSHNKIAEESINDSVFDHMVEDASIYADTVLYKMVPNSLSSGAVFANIFQENVIGTNEITRLVAANSIDQNLANKIFKPGIYIDINVNNARYADTAGSALVANKANFADKVAFNAIFGYNNANGNFVETERYDGSSEVIVTIEDLGGLTTANHTTMEVFVSGNDASIVSDTGITTNDGEFLKDRKLTIEAGNFITLTTIDDEEDPAHKRLKIDADAVHRSFTWQDFNGNSVAVVPEDDNCNIIFKEGDNVKFDVVSSYTHNANTTYPHSNPGSYTFQINAKDTLTFGAGDIGYEHEQNISKAIATYTTSGSKLVPLSEANWTGPNDYRDLYLDVVENGITTKHIADEAITSNKIYEVDAGKITSNNSVRLVLNCGGAKRGA